MADKTKAQEPKDAGKLKQATKREAPKKGGAPSHGKGKAGLGRRGS